MEKDHPEPENTREQAKNEVEQAGDTTVENDAEEAGATEEVEEELDEAQKLQRDLQEAKDKYLRLYSEFENFRRRTAKERLELIKTANQDLMVALIPMIDDFERALDASTEAKAETLKEGMELIHQKFARTLEQKGLRVMDSGIGKDFDAELHEAISKIPAPKKKLKNKIVDVVEKGYLLEDKVVRYAKVVIGS